MAAPTAIPDHHREVARRFAAIRRFNGWSQAKAAQWLGTNRAYLAHLESGRAAFPAGLGWKACQVYGIHWKWALMATPPQGPFPEYEPQVKDWLDDWFELQAKSSFFRAMAGVSWILEGPQGEAVRRAIIEGGIPLPSRNPACKPDTEDESPPSPSGNTSVGELTSARNTVTLQPVQPIMPSLIERLRRATAEHGRKTELAAWLGVPRQRVAGWLSGQNEPGGETTLRLLHWVTAEEAKSKNENPASVTAPAGPKAQAMNRHENETQSGPP